MKYFINKYLPHDTVPLIKKRCSGPGGALSLLPDLRLPALRRGSDRPRRHFLRDLLHPLPTHSRRSTQEAAQSVQHSTGTPTKNRPLLIIFLSVLYRIPYY